jgi:hypothetical protein
MSSNCHLKFSSLTCKFQSCISFGFYSHNESTISKLRGLGALFIIRYSKNKKEHNTLQTDPLSETLCSFAFFRALEDGHSPETQ